MGVAAGGGSSAAAGSAGGAAGGVWGMVFSTALNLMQQKMQADAQNRAQEEQEDVAKSKALLREQNAKNEATEAMLHAKAEVSRFRKDAAAKRSARRANWGGAGLANSGSVALNQTADAIQDRLDTQDMRFQAQQGVDRILSKGREAGNELRSSYGKVNKSTLSLGSKIYGPRR